MSLDGQQFDIAVIGAGISGLTAAFRLEQAGKRVVVLEEAERPGGVIQTEHDEGWLFELGPNTVLEGNFEVGRLISDLELGDRKVVASPASKKRYVWKGDRLVPLPGGPLQFLTTPLFPLSAKLRLLKEPWIARSQAEDESIADFARRRLGESFLRYAVGPFVSGVYAGDPERLSVRWATAKIAALEREHGSLIRGALAKRKGPSPGGAMISFVSGLEELPNRLAERLGNLKTSCEVESMARSESGFRLASSAGRIEVGHVVLTSPAWTAARLLSGLTEEARELEEIPYAPIVAVSLGFPRDAIKHPLDGFGFLVPQGEGLRILGCLFPSSLFSGRAPAGNVALAVFAGGRSNPAFVELDDEEIYGTILADLDRALNIDGEPSYRNLRRWPRAIPQYELGHRRFVDLASRLESDHPGLHFLTNFLGGVSVPDRILRANQLATSILAPEEGDGPRA